MFHKDTQKWLAARRESTISYAEKRLEPVIDPRKAQLLAAFDKLDDYGKKVLMAQAGSLLTLQRKPA